MNKFSIVAGLLLAASAATAQAAGTIDSLSLVPSTATVIDFGSEFGHEINGSYNIGAAYFSSATQYTLGQYAFDLGENGLWGGDVRFLSFDNIGSTTLDISFNGLTTKGFAFDFSAWQDLGSSDPVSVTVSYFDAADSLIGSHEVSIPAFGSTTYNAFLTTGYVSDNADIARISIAGDGVVLDNLTFTTPVPEPETYAMLLAGLGLLAGVARRRG